MFFPVSRISNELCQPCLEGRISINSIRVGAKIIYYVNEFFHYLWVLHFNETRNISLLRDQISAQHIGGKPESGREIPCKRLHFFSCCYYSSVCCRVLRTNYESFVQMIGISILVISRGSSKPFGPLPFQRSKQHSLEKLESMPV
jgi:hypothetical protein